MPGRLWRPALCKGRRRRCVRGPAGKGYTRLARATTPSHKCTAGGMQLLAARPQLRRLTMNTGIPPALPLTFSLPAVGHRLLGQGLRLGGARRVHQRQELPRMDRHHNAGEVCRSRACQSHKAVVGLAAALSAPPSWLLVLAVLSVSLAAHSACAACAAGVRPPNLKAAFRCPSLAPTAHACQPVAQRPFWNSCFRRSRRPPQIRYWIL